MRLEIYIGGDSYYVKGPDNIALKWTLEGERWLVSKEALPPNAIKVKANEVPDGLKEELMAFAARAATMGSQIWSMAN